MPVSGLFHHGDACCADGCCARTKTICVPECAKKVIIKHTYTTDREKVCYPHCSLFGHGCKSCGGCDTGCDAGCNKGGSCGCAWPKRYMVKHVNKCEKD